jgi:hypothetical protein
MLSEAFHLSDQELLLAADGELQASRAVQVRIHLAACWDCRARLAAIEGTIADFARAHRQTLDPQLPPIDGPRALLKAQLAHLAAQPNPGSWRQFFQFNWGVRSAAFVCVVVFVVASSGKLFLQHSRLRGENSGGISAEQIMVPDHGLTPGATRLVGVSDVCSMAHEDVARNVPAALRQEVFQEYGIKNARPNDYEIDYLIAPGLGGVADIHNLWPEPYTSRTWNAHVKDDLEEQLHQMVCAGKLDLSTAQNDIATNWIAAYKKYFHTDKPLSVRSGLISFVRMSFAVSHVFAASHPQHHPS